MKFFIQKRAGVTFFGNEPLSIGIRKRHVELVFKLESGWYGTVNLILYPEGVLLFTAWDKVLSGLTDAIPKVFFKEHQCETLTRILEGKNPDAQFTVIKDFEADGDATVLGTMVKCDNTRQIVEIVGLPEVVNRAAQLLNTSFAVHDDLYFSGIPELRALYN